jgi:hypothetical protein
MKTIKTVKLLALLCIISFNFVSCSDDHDDDHDHEEELITTVTYTLTNGNNVVTLEFEDLDGEGGSNGTTTVSGDLTANTIYTGVLKLENKTENPAEDITIEVKAEGDEHEFFYTSTVSGITITKSDMDANGNPIGINTTLSTGNAGTGSVTIILKHEPTKPNNGTSANAEGSTDVEVSFPLTVQ